MSARLPRRLHPLAWWIWAIGMATAVSRTTNVVLLGLVVAVVAWVVAARRPDAPWSRSFRGYLVLGGVVIAVRVGFYVLVGARIGDTEVVRLPEVQLPEWAAGIRLGGPVTLEGLAAAFADGMRLATLLACVGAANSLADAKRLLRCVPTVLYEVGTAVVVTLSLAPQLAESVRRVRRARTLRAPEGRGRGALRTIAVPVLADALDRSLLLAASMDARGYGRRGELGGRRRHVTGALVVVGLVGVVVGTYGLLDGTAATALGLPVLVVGVGLAAGGLALGHRRVRPTTYRPDPWLLPEWAVAASGVVVAASMVVLSRTDPDALVPTLVPLAWPTLPPLAAVAVVVGALPAWVAPPVGVAGAERRPAEPALGARRSRVSPVGTGSRPDAPAPPLEVGR